MSPFKTTSSNVEDAADKHRRGNEAYRAGDWRAAERLYSDALRCLGSDADGVERATAAIYLGNRAAARLMLSSPVEALGDCVRALALDDAAVRARMRLASCLQQLGAFVAAEAMLRPLLQSVQSDDEGAAWVRAEARQRAVAAGAADAAITRAEAILATCAKALASGVVEHESGDVLALGFAWMRKAAAAEEAARSGDDDAENDDDDVVVQPPLTRDDLEARAIEADELLSSAASAAPAAERVLVAKVQAALLLRQHAEAAKLVATPNSGGVEYRTALRASPPVVIGRGATGVFDPMDAAREAIPKHAPSVWRSGFHAISAYLLGQLDECSVACSDPALERASRRAGGQEAGGSFFDALAEQCCRLQQGREQGNAAFRAQSHASALASYTSCVENGGGFPVPASVAARLLCNRAAVSHATGDRVGALRDAALAASLDGGYGKPWRRAADVYRELRLPALRVEALERLLAVETLEEEALEEAAVELVDARREAEEAALPPRRAADLAASLGLTDGEQGADLLAVLGVGADATESEVRKAYHRLALRCHPDKAARNTAAVLRAVVWSRDADEAVAAAPQMALAICERGFRLIKTASEALSCKRVEYDSLRLELRRSSRRRRHYSYYDFY